jgi:tRNA (mo5U34)-methyltransferase
VDPYSYVRQWHGQLLSKGWWHSFELPDGSVIEGVNDLAAQKRRLAQYPIPQDLRGKRVLDIGAWDGWFSFEMERRGAEVVAIDRWENPRFYEIRRLLGSKVDYRELDVHDLRPEKIGRFDIVLFLGVL